MIGTKITKPVDDWQPYQEAAVWCNENKAVIEDKGEWYEVVALPEPTIHELKTRKLADLNSAFETASETAHCVSSAGFEINADETANRNVFQPDHCDGSDRAANGPLLRLRQHVSYRDARAAENHATGNHRSRTGNIRKKVGVAGSDRSGANTGRTGRRRHHV